MCKILWIEDDTEITRAGVIALMREAARTGVALSIEAAPTMRDARMRAHTADCILLDLGLPDSGVESTVDAMEHLCSEWPPVIVVSNFVDPEQPEAQSPGLYWRVLARGAENVYSKAEALSSPRIVLDAIRKAILKRMTQARKAQRATRGHAA